MILEYDDIAEWTSNEYIDNNFQYLDISGLCFLSSYVVEDIATKQIDDFLEVKIRISAFKKENKSGSFDFKIEIPATVNKIVFGKNEKIIWRRK